ncbi:hypothetical protein CAPTEDRAFT_197530 [Capitella teleta]|uniref:SAM-dependent MTase RsmB/NOP-type domain-containing protein n=1 Tax=Capitella teleta TaxID=283909 RepID=R7UQ31_CAPTE|nr:hypothetical protein CAPTEDRAFT_197530 [Capitella teleta]|eukprot:ELU08213.1 hypothetical protein CAPTEDRAFT_197530 [Capitella teleta]
MAERKRRRGKKEEKEVLRLESTKTEVEGYTEGTAFLNPIADRQSSEQHSNRHRAFEKDKEEHVQYMRACFSRMPCFYNSVSFQLAARIYQELTYDPAAQSAEDLLLSDMTSQEASGDAEFEDEQQKRHTYKLVFQTLKYKRFLDDMLQDCHFFKKYPQFKEDYIQVLIILCDFKERKFQLRSVKPGEEELEIPKLRSIEEALSVCKTKLDAALARSRIKARVLSVDHLLPDSVRQNEKIGSNMHVYCWVNKIKTDMQQVTDVLVNIGFERVDSEETLKRRTYYLDNQCPDAICFSYLEQEFLESHELLTECHLVVQDKSSCVGVYSVRALMNEGDDVLFINADGGLSIGHLASLTHLSDSVIYCFGVKTEKHYDTIIKNMARIGVKSILKITLKMPAY